MCPQGHTLDEESFNCAVLPIAQSGCEWGRWGGEVPRNQQRRGG